MPDDRPAPPAATPGLDWGHLWTRKHPAGDRVAVLQHTAVIAAKRHPHVAYLVQVDGDPIGGAGRGDRFEADIVDGRPTFGGGPWTHAGALPWLRCRDPENAERARTWLLEHGARDVFVNGDRVAAYLTEARAAVRMATDTVLLGYASDVEGAALLQRLEQDR